MYGYSTWYETDGWVAYVVDTRTGEGVTQAREHTSEHNAECAGERLIDQLLDDDEACE